MNNKILIGSIIAVSVLMGVSFTSVVGFNSVESDAKISPLFNIRSNGAVDEERKDIICNYVGKGDNININIPDRNNELILIQRFIDKIRKIDDKTFNKFINSVTHKIHPDNKLNYGNNMLRYNPEILNNNFNIRVKTLKDTPTLCWFPGCLLYFIMMFYYTYLTFSTVCTFYGPFCTLIIYL